MMRRKPKLSGELANCEALSIASYSRGMVFVPPKSNVQHLVFYAAPDEAGEYRPLWRVPVSNPRFIGEEGHAFAIPSEVFSASYIKIVPLLRESVAVTDELVGEIEVSLK